MAGAQLSSTHPPHPLPSEEDIVTCLRLLRSRRVGPATYRRMIREHGSASAALATLPDVAASAGVTDYQICLTGVVMAELKTARTNNARLLVQGTPDFTAALDDLDDAPPLLCSIGDTSLLARPVIAMVGARNASSLGTRMAKKLAADLGDAGYVIVSGLARGVDTAAHLASLTTGTIAVQAGGVDVIYPTENTALTQDIANIRPAPIGDGHGNAAPSPPFPCAQPDHIRPVDGRCRDRGGGQVRQPDHRTQRA